MPPRHTFGSSTLVCLVIANMIGAGVYTTSGFTLAALHTPGRVVLAWAIGGVIALCGAISYGRLARAMPESGGEYVFLARAAHPLLGFVAGWVSLIAGFTGAIAFAATAMEGYLLPAESPLPTDCLAIGGIVIAGLAHGFHPRFGAGIQNAFVVLKILLLLGFLSIAVFLLPDRSGYEPLLVETPLNSPALLIAAFAGTLVWISLSYAGFNAAVYIAEETHQAQRAVGRALILGTAIVTVLYIALNAIFVLAPSPQSVAGQPDVAAIAAEAIGGERLGLFVRGIIALSLFTSVTSMMLAAPRVYAKMADDGFMPRALQSRTANPRIAIVAQCLLAILFVLLSSLRDLLGYLGVTLSLCSACSVACLFLPKIQKQHPLGWSHIAAGFYLLATLSAAGIMLSNEPKQLIATATTFLIGAALYLVVQRQRIGA